jgi:thioredoxin
MFKVFTEANFNQEVLEASRTKPVLVDFFAVWCGPCQVMMPLVDALAQEMGDKASIGKIDTGIEAALSEKYDIMSVPTIMIFRNGAPVETLLGIQSKDGLKKLLEKHA